MSSNSCRINMSRNMLVDSTPFCIISLYISPDSAHRLFHSRRRSSTRAHACMNKVSNPVLRHRHVSHGWHMASTYVAQQPIMPCEHASKQCICRNNTHCRHVPPLLHVPTSIVALTCDVQYLHFQQPLCLNSSRQPATIVQAVQTKVLMPSKVVCRAWFLQPVVITGAAGVGMWLRHRWNSVASAHMSLRWCRG